MGCLDEFVSFICTYIQAVIHIHAVTARNLKLQLCLTILQEDEAVQVLTDRMKALLNPFVLRRLKSQVASQLTAKQQHEEVVSMTTEQAVLYQKAVQQLRADVAGNVKGVIVTFCAIPLSLYLLPCTHAVYFTASEFGHF